GYGLGLRARSHRQVGSSHTSRGPGRYGHFFWSGVAPTPGPHASTLALHDRSDRPTSTPRWLTAPVEPHGGGIVLWARRERAPFWEPDSEPVKLHEPGWLVLGRSQGRRRQRVSDLTGEGAPTGHCWSAPRPGGLIAPGPSRSDGEPGSGQTPQ